MIEDISVAIKFLRAKRRCGDVQKIQRNKEQAKKLLKLKLKEKIQWDSVKEKSSISY